MDSEARFVIAGADGEKEKYGRISSAAGANFLIGVDYADVELTGGQDDGAAAARVEVEVRIDAPARACVRDSGVTPRRP